MTTWKQGCPIRDREGQESWQNAVEAVEDADTAQARPIPAVSANCAPVGSVRRIQLQRLLLKASLRHRNASPSRRPGQAGRVQTDWNVEYGRVFSDLKQLLIVSAALFALMIVVGLFL